MIALAESFAETDHDAIVAGALVACEGTGIYQAEPAVKLAAAMIFRGIESTSFDRGQMIGESINLTRRLVNEPAAVLYPESFAEHALQVATECGL